MTLTSAYHTKFERLTFGLVPVPGACTYAYTEPDSTISLTPSQAENKYVVHDYSPAANNLRGFLGSTMEITFEDLSDGLEVPLPSAQLLQLHAALGRVRHESGAADAFGLREHLQRRWSLTYITEFLLGVALRSVRWCLDEVLGLGRLFSWYIVDALLGRL